MWRFCIDTGGTFTDCIATDPEGRIHRTKTLSSSALRGHVVEAIDGRTFRLARFPTIASDFYAGYSFCPLGDDRGIASRVEAWDSERGVVRLADEIFQIAAGALCELRSPEEPPTLAARILTGKQLDEDLPELEMRLATTRGTNALLERKGAKVGLLVTEGFGDLLSIGNQQRPDLFELGIQKPDPVSQSVFEVDERLDAGGSVVRPPNIEAVRSYAKRALADGVESFAVALLHSYLNSEHEHQVAVVLREAGARFVSVSSALSPFAKILPRAETSVVDAYLAPIMDAYLDAVEKSLGGGRLRVMNSAGGLASRDRFRPKDSLLSGPAGGVVGAARAGKQAGFDRSIAFDMGGTSTDVSRFDGNFDYRFEQRIGPARVFAPSLRIETVAAGGGSVCWFDGDALRVGPQSAGANPGPACYGAGGPLSVTDVNLLLGRLDVSQFGIPVSPEAARTKLEEMQAEIGSATGKLPDEQELLQGFLDIANERMAEAIRKISAGDGFDPADYCLVAFGGAGGLHACAVANILKMDTILFPMDAGLLSAAGLQAARLEQLAERQVLQRVEDCQADLNAWIGELEREARTRLLGEGVAEDLIAPSSTRFELRYLGQESVVTIEDEAPDRLTEAFEKAYRDQFGFSPEGLAVELVSIRVLVRSREKDTEEESFSFSGEEHAPNSRLARSGLSVGDRVLGPAVVQDAFSTVYLDDGWQALVGSSGALRLERRERVAEARKVAAVAELELFTNRYLSLVEEMGALLERLAFSTNVKERRDFSCALLDCDGYLVANAPHIPVHLGALGVCLRKALERLELGPGDVVVTNHPAFGGSHLPDVTMLAPVYSKSGDELLGYLANRAHHAEIGGIAPGSMPPAARNLEEEGVVIAPFKLVEAGLANWQPLEKLLRESRYPSRSPNENLADLRAQLASIRRGEEALRDLALQEGPDRVKGFMAALKRRSAMALRRALEKLDLAVAEGRGHLDDGAAVSVLARRISDERWLVDFSGSAAVRPNNYNATPAIVTSATIYALRLLSEVDIPLNEGFLDVVDIRIPEGMLNPDFSEDAVDCPAVVAGNVEISQLVVTVLLRAFGLAADSQTTMNNLIFGAERFGYYETIGGGEGATPQRDGASGAHTHMTNTAMTDPELMELRYPVVVERLALRRASGGAGRNRGGDGILKRIRFLEKVTLSLLTQRREQAPRGMAGGGSGKPGEQRICRANGNVEPLPGNGSFEIEPGDILEIETPGGGGWGEA